MRKIQLVFILALSMALALFAAGCGGGGAGGPGGGLLNPSAPAGGGSYGKVSSGQGGLIGDSEKVSTAATVEDVVSTLLQGPGLIAGQTSDGSPAGISSHGAVVDVTLGAETMSIPADLIDIAGNGLRSLSLSGANKLDGYYDVLGRLGGLHEDLGLQYANFGEWMLAETIQARLDGPGFWVYGMEMGGGFAFGDEDKLAAMNASGDEFTGLALGSAYRIVEHTGDGTVVPLMGDASLKMTDASNGRLELKFANFYDLAGPVNYVSQYSDRTFSGYFDTMGLENNEPNITGVTLPSLNDIGVTYHENKFLGASYGDGATATEAAGSFALETYDGGSGLLYGISGSFGMKK